MEEDAQHAAEELVGVRQAGQGQGQLQAERGFQERPAEKEGMLVHTSICFFIEAAIMLHALPLGGHAQYSHMLKLIGAVMRRLRPKPL